MDGIWSRVWSSSASNKSVAQSKVGGERPARWPHPMAAANPGGSHGRGGGVASAAARTSRALAAAPRVRVVGGENLLCGTQAGRKHKEKFSQAPNMSMVQVLMQQMITGVIRSQSLRSRRRSQHPLLPPLHSACSVPSLIYQSSYRPTQRLRNRNLRSIRELLLLMPRQRLPLHTRQRRLVQRLVL